jgi:FkbM family methyltransferase|tara:strand:- start:7073 stop:7729 length:657 start_codon:yes stop_codon:yes gene_type:complete
MTNPTIEGLQKLKQYIPQDNIKCLDVGANIGQWVNAIREVYSAPDIFSIEVNPHCEGRLASKQVKYKIIGLSDKVGQMELKTFATKPRSKGASFYTQSDWRDKEIMKFEVPVSTLDVLFPEQTFDILKIDVQGAELDVINGGIEFLKRHQYVLAEVALTDYNSGAPQASVVVARLQELGFYVVDCLEEHLYGDKIIQIDLLFSSKETKHNKKVLGKYV